MTTEQSPFLIVGLGNPGIKYHITRHNVGFLLLDILHTSHCPTIPWKEKFSGLYCQTRYADTSIVLLKPETYMNLSGESVKKCAEYFKIPHSHILIISDDIDMKFGKVRLRKSGSAGGHNGLSSIIQTLGTSEIARIKFGIGRDPHMPTATWVLSDFDKVEMSTIHTLAPGILEMIQAHISSF